MEHRRPKDDQQQVEHSLPGTNMAGKAPADECDSHDEQKRSRGQGDNINTPDNQDREQEWRREHLSSSASPQRAAPHSNP